MHQPRQFSLDDVKIRLRNFLDRQLLDPAAALLRSVVAHPDVREQLTSVGDDWLSIHQAFIRAPQRNFEKFQLELERLRASLRNVAENLRDEPNYLRPDWEEAFRRQYLGFEKMRNAGLPFIGLLATAEEICIPDGRLSAETDPDSYWKPGQKLDYKRELRLSLDCRALGDFSAAFDHCETVRTTLDPESAQLYEFLLLNFADRIEPQRIMHDAVFSEGRHLRHVKLYVTRFWEYQTAGKCASELGFHNVRSSAVQLADALFQIYADCSDDHVLAALQSAQPLENHRATVEKCIRLGKDLYDNVFAVPVFLHLTVNELCGGGRYQWVERVVVQRGHFAIHSLNFFDIETFLNDVFQHLDFFEEKDLLGPGVSEEPEVLRRRMQQLKTEQRDILRDNLLVSLDEKFQAVLDFWRRREEQRIAPEEFERRLREALVRLMYAHLVGYMLLKDKEFLQFPREQLLGQELLEWFVFDETGALAEHPGCGALGFGALEILEKILEIEGREDGSSAAASGLDLVWASTFPNYRRVTDDIFKNVETRHARNAVFFEKQNRLDLLECFRRWRILHLATQRQGDDLPGFAEANRTDFLEKIIRELSGQGLYQWIDFDPVLPGAVPEVLELGGFDPHETLKNYLRTPGIPTSEADARKHVAQRIFQKIKTDYEAIRRGDESARPALVVLLKKTLACFREHPAREYLDFLYDEIVGETKLAWLDIDQNSRLTNRTMPPGVAFDPLDVLRQLAGVSEKYDPFQTRKRLAFNRFHEAREAYFREVSEFPQHNGQVEREHAIGFIRRCKDIYRFFPEQVFLEIPFVELRGQGRIRWRNRLLSVFNLRFLFPFDYHTDNMHFNFNYQNELKQIQYLWNAQYDLMQKVREELGM